MICNQIAYFRLFPDTVNQKLSETYGIRMPGSVTFFIDSGFIYATGLKIDGKISFAVSNIAFTGKNMNIWIFKYTTGFFQPKLISFFFFIKNLGWTTCFSCAIVNNNDIRNRP